MTSPSAQHATPLSPPPSLGARIVGTGIGVPEGRLTNADLERRMDTSDEWIVQRTGIRERRMADPAKGETCTTLATDALRAALADARMDASELDLVILATVSAEMECPSSACRVIDRVGANGAAAFDLVAACSGFVYGLNTAWAMLRSGLYRNIAVIGLDVLTEIMEYATRARGISILFGDGGGCAIVTADDDPSRGVLAQSMHADGAQWAELYIPRKEKDYPTDRERPDHKLGTMWMNGREVFRFAVGTFPKLIQETLDKAGVSADDVDHYICHQSNKRILDAARERFNLPEEKMYVNIDRFGNTSAGSIPLCLHELRQQGRVREGQLVMFVAFGGGMTWASSLWRL